jgi:hypothetical protein
MRFSSVRGGTTKVVDHLFKQLMVEPVLVGWLGGGFYYTFDEGCGERSSRVARGGVPRDWAGFELLVDSFEMPFVAV